MTNRVLLSDTFKVSKPTVPVLTATGDDLLIDPDALAYVNAIASGSLSLTVTYTRGAVYAGSAYFYTSNTPSSSYVYYNYDNSALGVVPHIIYASYENTANGRVFRQSGPSFMYDQQSSKSGTQTTIGRPLYVEADRERFRIRCDAHQLINSDQGTSYTKAYNLLYTALAVGGDI